MAVAIVFMQLFMCITLCSKDLSGFDKQYPGAKAEDDSDISKIRNPFWTLHFFSSLPLLPFFLSNWM